MSKLLDKFKRLFRRTDPTPGQQREPYRPRRLYPVERWIFGDDEPAATEKNSSVDEPDGPTVEPAVDAWASDLLRKIDVWTPEHRQSVLVRLTLAAERDPLLRRAISDVLAGYDEGDE